MHKDLNKIKDTPMLVDWKSSYLKDNIPHSDLFESIWSLSKSQIALFTKIERLIQIHIEMQGAQNSQNSLEEKEHIQRMYTP